MTTQYPGSTAADVQAVLANVPVSTKNAIIKALTANGLLTDSSHIGIVSEVNPGYTTIVGNRDQLALLSPNSNTQVFSNKPIIVGLDTGTNYVSINRPNPAKDQADTVIGGSGKDTIVGNTAADSLVAGSGQEYVASGGGKDTLVGGSGKDTLSGGGQSFIVGGSGPTTITAGTGSNGYAGTPQDTVQAGTGKEKITLGYGNNTVYGPIGGGSATITAGTGSDTLYGPSFGNGAETINTVGGHTTFNLDSGSVTYNLSSKSADTVFGGQGAGFVNLNKASTDITGATATNIGGQSATTYTFAGGGSITTVGQVNLTFTDTRKMS